MIEFPPKQSQCMKCKHYIGYALVEGFRPGATNLIKDSISVKREKITCVAFPKGIPWEIGWEQTHDHRYPFPGDNGIRFEPKE